MEAVSLSLAAAASEDKAVKDRDLATRDLGAIEEDVVKVAGDDVVDNRLEEEEEATVAARRLDMF